MTRRPTVSMSPDKQGLKTAGAKLVRAIGGHEEAAKHCRVKRHQAFSEYGNHAQPDSFMPVDVVLDLERDTRGTPDWPAMTRYIASELGCALVVLPEAEPSDAAFIAAMGELTKEFSDISQGLCAALLDQRVTPHDVHRLDLIAQTDDLIGVGVKLRAMFERVLGEG